VGIGSDDIREWWFLDDLKAAVIVWSESFWCSEKLHGPSMVVFGLQDRRCLDGNSGS
jgi:hypothetical protein